MHTHALRWVYCPRDLGQSPAWRGHREELLPKRLLLAFWLLLALTVCAAAVPEWSALLAQYDYDAAAPLNAVVDKESPGLLGTEIALHFTSANGEKVPGLLFLPPEGAGKAPYPCVVGLHGLGGSKSDIRVAAMMIVPKGIAVLALDAQYHGDRKQDGKTLVGPDFALMRQAFIQTIIDYRRGLDYLATRPDIDCKRLGLVGASMGGIMGAVLTAVEPRLRTAVLVVAGGDWRTLLAQSTNDAAVKIREAIKGQPPSVMDPLDQIDPIYYVGHISPRPLLMQNGRRDDVVLPACARALWEHAGEPKAIDWYDSGHAPPLAEVLQKTVGWLAKHL